ncbi:hypothetical protein LJB42_003417 [Komagataella kurtzmanii]|nr:hypothetical protein LJB42_003417 [Komagataella kurtzmanii]
MGKLTTSESKVKEHHKPLYKDIVHGAGRFKTASQNSGRDASSEQKDGDDQDTIIDSKATRKILQLAKDQQEEIESEENRFGKRVDGPFVKFQVRQQQDEDEDDFTEEYDEMNAFEGSDGEEYDGEFEGEEEYVNEEDAKLFQSYFKPEQSFPEGSFNLADKVMAKIEQLQAEAERKNEKPVDAVLLPPKVIQAYQTIGTLLTTWTHGRLPKLFKVIPTLKRWEDVLYVTNPDAWTPNVCFEATKLFVSNFGSKDATKFVHMVLLERFRASIEDSDDHKLNYHLYRSLKKSLYKPAAFFKGFLFPLVEERCSVREAIIAGSILAKVSIPALHSAAALSWLTEQDFQPATTVFIRILLEKKYALPYQTVDNLVFYFMRFRVINGQVADNVKNYYDPTNKPSEIPPMPLVWHKAFLAFAQHYKNDITDDQRDFLLETIRTRGHRDIGPEIRRELLAGVPRTENTDERMEL